MTRVRDAIKRLFRCKAKQSVPIDDGPPVPVETVGDSYKYRLYRSPSESLSNVEEFLIWGAETKALSKYVIRRVEDQAAYFNSYLSFLNMHHLDDTPKLRKYWYALHRYDVIEQAMINNGMG